MIITKSTFDFMWMVIDIQIYSEQRLFEFNTFFLKKKKLSTNSDQSKISHFVVFERLLSHLRTKYIENSSEI